MHLTYNHGIFIPKQAYLSPQRKESQTYKRDPSIHLTCENPIIHLYKAASISSNNTYKKQGTNILETLIIHLSLLHHIVKNQHKCIDISNA